jgi:hypothetical protein
MVDLRCMLGACYVACPVVSLRSPERAIELLKDLTSRGDFVTLPLCEAFCQCVRWLEAVDLSAKRAGDASIGDRACCFEYVMAWATARLNRRAEAVSWFQKAEATSNANRWQRFLSSRMRSEAARAVQSLQPSGSFGDVHSSGLISERPHR